MLSSFIVDKPDDFIGGRKLFPGGKGCIVVMSGGSGNKSLLLVLLQEVAGETS